MYCYFCKVMVNLPDIECIGKNDWGVWYNHKACGSTFLQRAEQSVPVVPEASLPTLEPALHVLPDLEFGQSLQLVPAGSHRPEDEQD